MTSLNFFFIDQSSRSQAFYGHCIALDFSENIDSPSLGAATLVTRSCTMAETADAERPHNWSMKPSSPKGHLTWIYSVQLKIDSNSKQIKIEYCLKLVALNIGFGSVETNMQVLGSTMICRKLAVANRRAICGSKIPKYNVKSLIAL